jgi:hypothetical protein
MNSNQFETGSMKDSHTMHFNETQIQETNMFKKQPKKWNSLKKGNHAFRQLDGSEGEDAENYARWGLNLKIAKIRPFMWALKATDRSILEMKPNRRSNL